MRQTFVVTVEGVLRKLTDGQPIVVALGLLESLGQGNSFIYLTEEAAKETEEWLDDRGLSHDLVLGRHEDRVLQLQKIRHEWGYPIDAVIEPDPAVAAKLVEAGYTVLGFFHPHYARSSWRPGSKFEVTPWDDVKASVIDDLRQAREDARKQSREIG